MRCWMNGIGCIVENTKNKSSKKIIKYIPVIHIRIDCAQHSLDQALDVDDVETQHLSLTIIVTEAASEQRCICPKQIFWSAALQ